METKFFNRELSWIEFNNRILYNAFKKELPLMERLQFLSIVSSNFDEFFQVRVASVKRMEKSNPKVVDDSGYTPKSLLRQISSKCHKIIKDQHNLLMNELVPLLAEKNLKYTTIAELDAKQKIFVTEFFENEVFPFLTPLRTDSNLFPHLINLSEYIAFYLKAEDAEKQKKSPFKGNDKASKVAFVQIPNGLDRIVWLPTENGKKQFVLLEEVILEFGKILFPGFYVKESMILQKNIKFYTTAIAVVFFA
jgi:polyphosphate kinase